MFSERANTSNMNYRNVSIDTPGGGGCLSMIRFTSSIRGLRSSPSSSGSSGSSGPGGPGGSGSAGGARLYSGPKTYSASTLASSLILRFRSTLAAALAAPAISKGLIAGTSDVG